MDRKKIRVFVSSPGDVQKERQIADRVIGRLAAEFEESCQLEGYFWEHEPMLATKDFQSQIPLMDEFDIVLCILWSRLGSPLHPGLHKKPDGSRFSSGTEYEFENAKDAFFKSGEKPHLLPFICTREPHIPASPKEARDRVIAQIDALEEFKKRQFFDEKVGAFIGGFNVYGSLAEFEEKLETFLRKELAGFGISVQADCQTSKPAWSVAEKGSPFRGLNCFEFEHSSVFFGRTKAIDEVLNALRKQIAEGRAFVLIFGGSGGGKSSLLRAGILPLLTRQGVMEGIGLWRRAVLRPAEAGSDLSHGLVRALVRPEALPELLSDGTTIDGLARELREAPGILSGRIKDGLSKAARELQTKHQLISQPRASLVLAIDQMEELFTLDQIGTEERERFIRCLGFLARSGFVAVLATLRSEFFPRCAEIPELVALKEGAGQYQLVPPSSGEITQMIRLPAQAAGLRFEREKETGAGLDDALLEAARGQPGALSLLQFALDEIFKSRGSGNVLPFEAYRGLGGLEGALRQRAEEVFTTLSAEAQSAFPSVFRRLVRIQGDEAEGYTRQWARSESFSSPPGAENLINGLSQARLLVSDTAPDGAALIGVAHEALLIHWPRLRDWLGSEREFFLATSRLETATSRWLEKNRETDFLLAPGKQLAEAEELLAKHGDGLTGQMVDFIRDSALKAREAARARMRRWQAAASVFALLSFLAAGLGFFAWRQKLAAEDQEKATRQAFSRSDFLNGTDLVAQSRVREGAAYLVSALRLDPTNRAAFLSLFQEMFCGYWPQLRHAFHDGELNRAAFSPDSRFIVTASRKKTAQIWEVETGKPIGEPMPHEEQVMAAEFSPDGHWILTTPFRSPAILWEAGGAKRVGRVIGEIPGPNKWIKTAVFSPDSKLVLTAFGKSASLIDTSSGKQVGEKLQHEDEINSAAFSSDSHFIVTASNDKTARIWETSTGKQLGESILHDQAVLCAGFSPDCKRIFTHSKDVRDTPVRIWEVESRKQLGTPIRGLFRGVTCSPDGMWLVTASVDHYAESWFATNGRTYGLPMRHTGIVNSAIFSPDSRFIVTASQDQTARVWDRFSSKPLCGPMIHSFPPDQACFSPNGRWILTHAGFGPALLWDAPVRKTAQLTIPHPHPVITADFSPDGRFFLTTSAQGGENFIQIRETATGKAVGEAIKLESGMAWAGFSPDGKLFLTTSWKDLTACVRDSATGKPVGKPLRPESGKGRSDFRDLNRLPGYFQGFYARFSPDSRFVVTNPSEFSARIWDARTGEPVGAPIQPGSPVLQAVFRPDGKAVLVSCNDRNAQAWEISTGKTVGEPLFHETLVSRAEYSPDGQRIVTTSYFGKLARVWEAATSRPLTEPMIHSHYVLSARFSPDGRWILTLAADGAARVWDAVTGAQVGEPMRSPEGREILSAGFSPDSAWVVTASSDCTARVWDASTGKQLGEAFRHENWVKSAVFSPDGRSILTASMDKTARVWLFNPFGSSLPSEEFLLAASRMAGVRLNLQRGFEDFPLSIQQVRDQISGATNANPATQFARWLLADPTTRPADPFAPDQQNPAQGR